jgi:putative SOS response-associated peptidase YedK
MVCMCGCFTLRAPAGVIAEQFALFEAPPFTARFNIAPSQPAPLIRMRPNRTERDRGSRELVWLRWGLIPGWAQDPAEQMKTSPVGSFVNNPANDDPRCIEARGLGPVRE